MRLITALITPFKKYSNSEDVKIDFEAVELLLKEQFYAGVREVVIMGSTGEGHSLSRNERIELVEFVISVKNKLNQLSNLNSSLIGQNSPHNTSQNSQQDNSQNIASGEDCNSEYKSEYKSGCKSDYNSDYNQNHQIKDNLNQAVRSTSTLNGINAFNAHYTFSTSNGRNVHHISNASGALTYSNNSNQMKIIASINSNITQFALDQINDIKKYDMNGLDGLMSACPYYNKPTQEGIFQHFSAIANSVNMPIMLYDIPGRTGISMANETLQRLINNFSNIESIKLSTNELSRMNELFYFLSGGDLNGADSRYNDLSGGYLSRADSRRDLGGDSGCKDDHFSQSCRDLNASNTDVKDMKVDGDNGESAQRTGDSKNFESSQNAENVQNMQNNRNIQDAQTTQVTQGMQIMHNTDSTHNADDAHNTYDADHADCASSSIHFDNINFERNSDSKNSDNDNTSSNSNNIHFNNGVSVLCGDDESILSFGVNGAAGVVSVISNAFPNEMVHLCSLIQKKDFVNALNLFKKLQIEMRKISFTTNPIGIKKAVSDKYNFVNNICRLPLIAFE